MTIIIGEPKREIKEIEEETRRKNEDRTTEKRRMIKKRGDKREGEGGIYSFINLIYPFQ